MDKLNLKIEAIITNDCMDKFKEEVQKIAIREKGSKYILFRIYCQLGQQEKGRVFEDRGYGECIVIVQPKIKTYTIFQDKDVLYEYIDTQILKEDLYMIYDNKQRDFVKYVPVYG